MKVIDFLEEEGVKWELTKHRPSFTAQSMAASEHERGKYVAKPVLVKTEQKYVLCVLGACYKIDLDALKEQLGAEAVELATEKEIAGIFEDCELGAEPPFGNLYEIATVIDEALLEDNHIRFQAGTHESAIKMDMDDYRRLVEPKVLRFSYHLTS